MPHSDCLSDNLYFVGGKQKILRQKFSPINSFGKGQAIRQKITLQFDFLHSVSLFEEFRE